MKKLFALLAFALSASAQTVTVYPSTVSVARGGYPTLTAIVGGVNNKTVTWSTDCGTLVGTNPGTANEPNTIALYSTTAQTCHVTATSNANSSVSASSTVTFTASPTRTTGHPRLGGVNSSNLAAIQAKAVTGNTVFNSGLKVSGNNAVTADNPYWNWTDTGGTGQPTGDMTESDQMSPFRNFPYDAYTLASMAALTTDTSHPWGSRARDMFLYYANFWLNPLNTAYSSASLDSRRNDANYGLTGNRGSDNTEAYTLTPDMLMAAGWLGGGSGATLTATITGGTMNTPTISSGGSGYLANTYQYWWAPVGSSGCTSIGDYGNGQGTGGTDIGTPMAAYGLVQVNVDGLVSGSVVVLKNATGCTTAPTITVKSDKDLIRDFLMVAAQNMATITLSGARAQIGGYNSISQFNTGSDFDFTGQRAMGNNYTLSKIMFLTAAWLTFDDNTTDSPATPNTCSATRYVVCPDGTAGSLQAYGSYLTGGMLLKEWTHLEDQNVSLAALHSAFGGFATQPQCLDSANATSTAGTVPCFGDGRGGESSEGSWYGYSMYRLALAAASLHSAGVDDPMVYGPQMSLGASSFWDLKLNSDLAFLAYSYYPPQPRWLFYQTGDSLNAFRNTNDFSTEAWMLAFDAATGRTDRKAKELWPIVTTPIGGPSHLYSEMNNGDGFQLDVPMFIGLPSGDPVTSPPADPRGSLPTDVYVPGNQHIFARSGWVTGPTSAKDGGVSTQTVFSAACPMTRIDHEYQQCSSFDLLSNGEFITKIRMVDNNYNYALSMAENSNILGVGTNQAQTSPWQNTGSQWGPAILGVGGYVAINYPNGAMVDNGNSGNFYKCTGVSGCSSTDTPSSSPNWTSITRSQLKGGGQQWHGYSAGNATLNHSELPDHVAFNVDTTNLYNGSATDGGFATITGVTGASRSLVYLRNLNHIVYYDRSAGGFASRDWLNTTGAITISGHTASWLTRSNNQKAVVTSLLPSGATVSDAGAYITAENNYGNSVTDWEPYSHILIDAGAPASTQFLTDLQWAAAAATPATPTLLQSSSGQAFDGEKFATTAVLFMRNWPGTFSGTTYPASGATSHYIADLSPNTTYTVTASGAPATATTDNAGVLAFSSDGTGSVSISTGGTPTASAPTFTPGAGSYTGTQSVTLATPSAGAIICFNTTGSPATNGTTGCAAGSTLYSGPVSVASSETLYARAGGTGWLDSSASSAAYTIGLPQASTPTCTPSGGTYTSAQTATCSSVTTGSVTRCTTDGSTPNGSSPICTAIAVNASLTIKAFAQASGFTDSAVDTEAYTINLPGTPQVTTTNAVLGGTVVIQ